MAKRENDLEVLVKDFLDLYKVVDEISQENDQIKEEIKISDKRIFCYGVAEKNFHEEIGSLQSLVTSYQNMLLDHNNIKETVIELNDSLEKLTKEKKKLEQDAIMNKESYVLQLTDLQDTHKKEIQRVQLQLQELACGEIEIYKEKLDESMKEISKLKRNINEIERKHQSEITKVQLEYDSKVQKIQQRQLAQANTSAGSMSARNDIFRKKLQHLQMESEKELKILRTKCNEQQLQITEQQHQYKLQNKKVQELSKKSQDQVRQQESQTRQTQAEMRRLQSLLAEEKENVNTLKNEIMTLQQTISNQQQQQAQPKRRRSMFNPNNNRLGGTI